MDTLLKANIFFFITTIAVVLLTLALLIAMYYIVKSLRRLAALAEKVEENLKDATVEVREMAEDMRDSALFNLVFRKRRKKRMKEDN